MSKARLLICPYCGESQPVADRCRSCRGYLDQLSRQATHNAMGPWFIRDHTRPFQPGCSYETIVKLLSRGQIDRYTIIRSPTTRQFWTIAKHVPGLAHLLGYCHRCDASVDPGDHGCHACGAAFGAYMDRNFLGLPDVQPMPWEAPLPDDDEGEMQRRQEFVADQRDVDQAPTPSKGAQHAGASAGGRISSFATDDELRSQHAHWTPTSTTNPSLADEHDDHGEYPAVAQGRQQSAVAQGERQQEPADVQTQEYQHGRSDEPSASGPAVESALHRALQRRLQQQQRTIRALTIAVTGALVIATVLALIALGQQQSPPAATPDDQPTTEQAGGPQAASDQPVAAGEDDDDGNDAAEPPAEAANSTSEDSAAQAPSAERDTDSAVRSVLRDVAALIESGEDSELPTKQRLEAYQRARTLLDEMLQNRTDLDSTTREQIATLQQQIENARERLEIDQFFNNSDQRDDR